VDDCCAVLPVPGGSVTRSASGAAWDGPVATVSDFGLDVYEVSVARFRVFVDAGLGTQATPPTAGAGAHPKIAGSGWLDSYDAYLPANIIDLRSSLACGPQATWTDSAGSNEGRPLDCSTWFLAFAFCAWDGGSLPTEAEWVYAAAGGTEQRAYAWTTDASAIDPTYAEYGCGTDAGLCVAGTGTHPKGAGKWGQMDLTGNVHEWVLDYYHATPPSPCNDCADLDPTGASGLSFHGGSYDDIISNQRVWTRFYTFSLAVAATASPNVGIRCVRAAR
jgi:formylglycine-generating enzyme required for sulfatase activity